jgi:hypothetical protein
MLLFRAVYGTNREARGASGFFLDASKASPPLEKGETGGFAGGEELEKEKGRPNRAALSSCLALVA